ncbi:MAG TPA: hypothetical protein V6D22_24065 [Candidatus Obscuribacterales bacterium]
MSFENNHQSASSTTKGTEFTEIAKPGVAGTSPNFDALGLLASNRPATAQSESSGVKAETSAAADAQLDLTTGKIESPTATIANNQGRGADSLKAVPTDSNQLGSGSANPKFDDNSAPHPVDLR